MKKFFIILFLFVGLSAKAQFVNNNGRIFNIQNYGAKGDGKRIFGCSMTGSTAVLTGSGFVSTDVGKAIRVPGAGAAGVDLITTISAFTNSTTITLTASSATAVSADTVMYGTDNTAAIQAAITACGLAGGGTIWVPNGTLLANGENGVYIVGGAPVTSIGGNNPNSQIYFPVAGLADGISFNTRTHFTVQGESLPNYTPSSIAVDSLVQHQGAVIYSIIDGAVNNSTPPAVFGTKATNNGFGPFNYNYLTFKNLTVLVSPNVGNGGSTMTGINGYWCASLITDNVLVGSDHAIFGQPVLTNKSAGIIFNAQGTESMAKCKDTWVEGMYYGIVTGENTTMDNPCVLGNIYGFVIGRNFLAAHGSKVQANYNAFTIYSPNTAILGGMVPAGNSYLNIETFDVEIVSGGSALIWWKNSLLLSDTGNHIIGNINYSLTVAGSGHLSSSWNINGGANVQCTAIDIPQWTGSPASIPTLLTSQIPVVINSTIVDGFKLISNLSSRGNIYVQNTNSGGYAANLVENNRGSFASFGGMYMGGSSTAFLNDFGLTNGRDVFWLLGNGGSLTAMAIGTTANAPLIFGTNDAERGRIFGGGNFALGAAPTDKAAFLQIPANTTTNASLFFNGGASNVTSPTNGMLYYNSTAHTLMFTDNSVTSNLLPVNGQTTLVSGTKTITCAGAVAGSVIQVTLNTPTTASLTIMYQGTCTTGSCTIQANIGAGTINASDASVVNYTIFR